MKHLAVLHKGPLKKILEGEKTIESRFSKNRSPPFGKIKEGDTLFLKESSGPVKGVVKVSKVLYFSDLTRKKVKDLFLKYKGICAKDFPEFVRLKLDSNYATLMFLEGLKTLNPPLDVKKKDRRAWVILDYPTQQSLELSFLP